MERCVRTLFSWTGHWFRTTLKIGEMRRHFGLQSIDERGRVRVCFLKLVGKDGVRVVVGFLNGKSPGKPPFLQLFNKTCFF